MPFATIQAAGPFPGDDATDPFWALFVDGRRVTSTTMSIDHSVDPLSVDHHCSPSIDCSFKRLVSVRRLGRAIVWICPLAARDAPESAPQPLDAVMDGPIWFAEADYRAWLASMAIDPAIEMAHIPPLSPREADEILWLAASREFDRAADWPLNDPWSPPWRELLGERLWHGVEPEDHPCAPFLLQIAAIESPSFTLVDAFPALPERACRLTEVLGEEGEWSGVRLAACKAPDGPALFHVAGRGVWAQVRLAP